MRCPTGLKERSGIEGWWRRPTGATKVEYLVLLVLGIFVMLGSIQIFGGGVGEQFDNASDVFARAMGDEPEDRGRSGQSGARSGDRSQQGSERASASGQEDDEDPGRGVHTGDVERDRVSMQGGRSEESSGSVGGVSPFVVVFMILLVLLVGYFLFSEDS